ncbi:MAG: hypothetical protein HY738_23805 [Bacteroidia bacterium]|nr:hypothetical protein [Bacteroidia bacterium]
MMLKTKKIFVILFLFLFTSVFAQNYKFKKYGIDEGLSQSFVYDMTQDAKGYLWIGTGEGLNRFDGLSFVVYTSDDSLTENFITSCYFDRSEIIWIGHNQGGISIYQNRAFKKIESGGKINSAVNDICEDKHGNIWMVAQNEGLFKIRKDGILMPFICNLSTNFYSVNILNDNELLVGTSNGLFITKFSDNGGNNMSFQHINEIPEVKVQCINKIADSDVFWVGTEGEGLFKLTGNIDKAQKVSVIRMGTKLNLTNLNVQDAILDNESNLWIATFGSGIFKLLFSNDDYSQSFINYNENNGLGNNYVKKIYKDKEGNILAGTYGGGLIFLTGDYFTFYSFEGNDLSNNVLSIYFDDQYEWFGTDKGLVCKEINGHGKIMFYSDNNGLPKEKITSLYVDFNGTFWIGTEKAGYIIKK